MPQATKIQEISSKADNGPTGKDMRVTDNSPFAFTE